MSRSIKRDRRFGLRGFLRWVVFNGVFNGVFIPPFSLDTTALVVGSSLSFILLSEILPQFPLIS